MKLIKDKPEPGQESVWDYPRPPRLEASSKTVRVFLQAELIASSNRAYRVLETSHPPTWYLPPEDIKLEFFTRSAQSSFCEWKGAATYWSVKTLSSFAEDAAWSYESPNKKFFSIKGYLSFYANHYECYVDDERVVAQPGGLYGGWITRDVVGPFKGIPGSWGW